MRWSSAPDLVLHSKGQMNHHSAVGSGDHAAAHPLPATTSVSPAGWHRRRLLTFGLFLLCAALCLLVVFRPFFASRFDLTLSDPGDGRFGITILEHWTRVFHGQGQVASPNFFYPDQGVLGYSDGLLLIAIPFAVMRSLGLDRYLATQITTMLLTVVGLAAMFVLLRRVLRFDTLTALVGAGLFVISNMNYIAFVHIQLQLVVVIPAFFLLAAMYWEDRNSRPVVARVWICTLGIMLGLFSARPFTSRGSWLFAA